mgnify:CR=1 FL=1
MTITDATGDVYTDIDGAYCILSCSIIYGVDDSYDRYVAAIPTKLVNNDKQQQWWLKILNDAGQNLIETNVALDIYYI